MRTTEEIIELSPYVMTEDFVRTNAPAVLRMLAVLLVDRNEGAGAPIMIPEAMAEHGNGCAVRYGYDRKHALVILRAE